MLKLDHVSLELGNQTVLRDVSFEVQPQEMVAILGISGAGKSSLFPRKDRYCLILVFCQTLLLRAYSTTEDR